MSGARLTGSRVLWRVVLALLIASIGLSGCGGKGEAGLAGSAATTPPVIFGGQPVGTLSAGTTQTTMSVTSNETATCKWGISDTSYAELPNTFTTTGSTLHSAQITGLSNGQSYVRYVRCQDGAGNANLSSYTVSFSVGTGAGPLTLSLNASRTSGVAPLAVFFDATGTTGPPQPFHHLDYRWNFGDPAGSPVNGTTWSRGSRAGVSSRNSATGPVAAHVYETPGTYTVTLTAFDGTNTSSTTVTVTVADPETVFAGTNTVCFSTAGEFTGCPLNARRVTDATGNFATAINNNQATSKRLLFRRGETWNAAISGTSARLSVSGPGIVGAFGAGTPPVIRGNTYTLVVSGQATPGIGDWRVMDLEFDGLSGGDSRGVQAGGGASQITLLRLRIHDAHFGVVFDGNVLDAINAGSPPAPHVLWDQIAIADCDIRRMIGGSGGNGMFLWARRLAILGNLVEDSTGAEHIIRVQFVYGGVIQANQLGFPASGKSVLTVRAESFGSTGIAAPYNNTTQNVVIAENLMRAGLSQVPTGLEPNTAGTDQRIRNAIYDGNFIIAGSNLQMALGVSADEVTVRNNIFNLTGADTYRCMHFFRWGIEPAHSGIRVYNNTCYTNDAGPPPLRVVVLDDITNAIVANNLGYAPNSSSEPQLLSGSGSTGVTGGSGTLGNSSNTQIRDTSPNFANPSGTFLNAGDFALNAPSYAINGGVAVPVFKDLPGNNRPLGAGFDTGAWEQP